MLTALIGPISSLASTWLEGKVEKTKAETGAKVARAKAEATIMEKKATGEIDWDLEAIKGSQNSWKCLNGTSTAWALLLLRVLESAAQQNSSVKNRGSKNGRH